jgi:TRAP-type C4-dicarboxylate transport system permease small subunit
LRYRRRRHGRDSLRKSRGAKNFSIWPRPQNKSNPLSPTGGGRGFVRVAGKMKELIKKLAKRIEAFNRAMYWFSAIAILVSSLILTYEVVMRYFLKIPTIWEIESAIYLGILATFMGAAYGLKDGAHINIDLITRTLPSNIQSKLFRITAFISLIFCIYLAYKGWQFWWEAFSKGWRSESLWGPPLAIPYFFLPLGMSLLSLQLIIQIFGLAELRDSSHPEKSDF